MSVCREIERRSESEITRRRQSSILVGRRLVELGEEYGDKESNFVVTIIKLYQKWGFIITKYSWIAIPLCLTFSALGMLKILYTSQRNELTGYVPYEARSRVELQQYTSFFSQNGLPIISYLFLQAIDGGSLLRDEYFQEVIETKIQWKLIVLYVNVAILQHFLDSRKLLGVHFGITIVVQQNGWRIQKSSIARGDGLNPHITLDYPISSIFGIKFSLQPNFYGVELDGPTELSLNDSKSAVSSINKTQSTIGAEASAQFNNSLNDNESRITNMKAIKLIALQFRAQHSAAWTDYDVKDWELRFVRFFQKEYVASKLKIFPFSQTYVEVEMVRAGTELLPYLTVGFVIMCLCSTVTVMTRAIYMHQGNFYKIILAVMACVTPLLACQTALGILFLFGMRFSSILCVIPFLVLSIGVDSSYLMIHEWQRVTKENTSGEKKSENSSHRMSEVLSEVGPAILISALTNILADGVGCTTSSPEIQLLCLGNLFSMFVAYIYQMTFYSGLMAIVGGLEIEAEKRNKEMVANADAENQISRSTRFETHRSRFHDASKLYIGQYMSAYVDFLTHHVTSFLVILVYLIYIFLSIWLENLRIRYQLPKYTLASVFINNAGNLSNPSHYTLINQMVRDFEALPGSWGSNGTMFFLRDFAEFNKNFKEEDYDYDFEEGEELQLNKTTSTAVKVAQNIAEEKSPINMENMRAFLSRPEYNVWSGFVYFKNETDEINTPDISRFFFLTAYHGESLVDWVQRGILLGEWRKIVDKPIYKTFDASVFHEDAVFLDLVDNMPTDTWQSILGTLICMAAVCFLFLRDMLTVLIATSCVLSICIGILGIGSWWGIDLDPISVAAMIISIGFSVDIPAHVSYHYYQACESGPNASSRQRLGNCLSTVAFPAVQAALSTILCVISLTFVHVYMSTVFVKTMIVCVLLCNIHGLVFLPAMLASLDNIVSKFRSKTAESQKIQRKKRSRYPTRNCVAETENDRTKVDRPSFE